MNFTRHALLIGVSLALLTTTVNAGTQSSGNFTLSTDVISLYGMMSSNTNGTTPASGNLSFGTFNTSTDLQTSRSQGIQASIIANSDSAQLYFNVSDTNHVIANLPSGANFAMFDGASVPASSDYFGYNVTYTACDGTTTYTPAYGVVQGPLAASLTSSLHTSAPLSGCYNYKDGLSPSAAGVGYGYLNFATLAYASNPPAAGHYTDTVNVTVCTTQACTP